MKTIQHGNGAMADLMQLHDRFLNHAKQGGITLTSRECRSIAIQLVYEMAKLPNMKILPFPQNVTNFPTNANSNIPNLVA